MHGKLEPTKLKLNAGIFCKSNKKYAKSTSLDNKAFPTIPAKN